MQCVIQMCQCVIQMLNEIIVVDEDVDEDVDQSERLLGRILFTDCRLINGLDTWQLPSSTRS